MTAAATVLVPTHNHGRLLRLAVESALAQTVGDLDIFIVGDGATDETKEAARALERADRRVRFFDNEKGEHHGEAYRHAALQEATAPIVCYLSDDDLWFPDHVEYLSGLLEEHDFAHGLPVGVRPDGSIYVFAGNLEQTWWRRFVEEEGNFIPLNVAGHTVELYRKLPHGWRPADPNVWSDLYMWRQILSVPGCRAVSGSYPTSLHFTSARRTDADPEGRWAELTAWAERVSDPLERRAIRRDVYEALAVQLAHTAARDARLTAREQSLRRKLAATTDRDAAAIAEQAHRAERAEAQIATLRGTRTWRWRTRLLGLPLVGPVIRTVGRALSRRAGR